MNNILKNTKTHRVEVIVTGPFINLFLKKIYRLNIDISNIKYLDDDKISFVTSKENFETIKNKVKDYQVSIKKDIGIYTIIPLIKKSRVFLIALSLGIVIFIILQNIIVKVDVIHSDKNLRESVKEQLEEYGIKRLSFKKSYKEIQIIKKKVLDKYPDTLEWIEIENVGMTYKVRMEQRIITKIKNSDGYCHIVAKKNGIITKVENDKGETIKQPNDYVSKGDIVISGIIKANEETKNNLCAEGKVFAEVWYNVYVSIPFNYQKKEKTGHKRINFMYDNQKEKKVILKSRFKNKIIKNKKIFSLFGVDFYIQTEYEVNTKNKKYNDREIIKRALDQTREKINIRLSDKERIIMQKVLKSNKKNSKIELEIFVSVEEEIGKLEHYEITENTETLE